VKKNFINKKKKNFSNIGKSIFLLVSIFSIIFIVYVNFNNFKKYSFIFIQQYSDKFDNNLSKIEITNLDYISEKEILSFFDLFIGKSILLIPIKKTSEEILAIQWIKNISIESDYKNTIKISLEEEVPLGIYYNNNQKILFSNNLKILEIMDNKKKFSGLITFYGKNSIYNSKALLLDLDDKFKDSVERAIFIANRRWNLKLSNQILLKLPQNNIKEAIIRYKMIYKNSSNKDLKKIESIDLRILNQAIIKYKNR
jgi:cell division septal protein FtsQ